MNDGGRGTEVAPETAGSWVIPLSGQARLTWEYGSGRPGLLGLYQRGKDKQWDVIRRIDWDQSFDPAAVLSVPPEVAGFLAGSPVFEAMAPKDRARLQSRELAWQLSQFLHGEQAALTVAARIVESVPDMDSKLYAATQAMDEARHVEVFSRLVDKVGVTYPACDPLLSLLKETLSDSRWDMPYLGMQVLIEGLALAAFATMRDVAASPLLKQVLAYVMQDEARHVAFGQLALRDCYTQLSEPELRDRAQFVIEGCALMRDRLLPYEVWQQSGLPAGASKAAAESPAARTFRRSLFSRIVPALRNIGLLTGEVRDALSKMGVLDFAAVDLDALTRQDDQIAAETERQAAAEMTARAAEVDDIIRLGEEVA